MWAKNPSCQTSNYAFVWRQQEKRLHSKTTPKEIICYSMKLCHNCWIFFIKEQKTPLKLFLICLWLLLESYVISFMDLFGWSYPMIVGAREMVWPLTPSIFDSTCPFTNTFRGWIPRWFCLPNHLVCQVRIVKTSAKTIQHALHFFHNSLICSSKS